MEEEEEGRNGIDLSSCVERTLSVNLRVFLSVGAGGTSWRSGVPPRPDISVRARLYLRGERSRREAAARIIER